jgi:hypothetical protein
MIDESTMNPIGLLFTLGMGFLLLVMPRRFAVLPLITSACFITLGQEVTVAGLHFTALRIIVLFGWIRLFTRRELSLSIKLNIIDKIIIIYAAASFIRLFQSSSALNSQLGFVYNLIGIYFLFRFCIRDFEDIERTIKILALCLIPLAGFMLFEMFTGRNIFSVFGGTPEIAMVRDGKVRCQGPFRHPILAGTLGAVSIPLLIGLLANRTNRRSWVILSIAASTVITITSHSSGPAMAYGFGLIGLLSWVWRRHMRLMRWGLFASLLFFHMVMKAPVWYLMVRVSEVIGGGGWHRAFLVDQAIRHLNEWWLIGTGYTAHWMPYALELYPDAADITNQFVAEGVSGGLLRMSLFITIIVVCFRTVGRSVRMLENTSDFLPFLVWGLGASLLAHVTSFFSVSYFDQIILIWYMLWAMIAAAPLKPSSPLSETGHPTDDSLPFHA